MLKDKSWKSIKELRQTDRDFSGMAYSFEYAKEHKAVKDYDDGLKCKALTLNEILEIKKQNAEIFYRVTSGSKGLTEKQFKTQFGTFKSIDHGEFGGKLITPKDKSILGNFKYVFDLGNTVIAISTLAHFTIYVTKIYRFTNGHEYQCIFSVGDWTLDMLETEKSEIDENLKCPAIYIIDNVAYLLLTGYITIQSENGGSDISEIKLFKLTEAGDMQEILCLVGKVPNNVKNIIVENNKLYIAMDKMLAEINIETKAVNYFTVLSEEDENDLISQYNSLMDDF